MRAEDATAPFSGKELRWLLQKDHYQQDDYHNNDKSYTERHVASSGQSCGSHDDASFFLSSLEDYTS